MKWCSKKQVSVAIKQQFGRDVVVSDVEIFNCAIAPLFPCPVIVSDGLVPFIRNGVNGFIVFIPAFTDVLIITLGILVDAFTILIK